MTQFEVDYTSRMVRTWWECVNQFCRENGIDETNAHLVEIQTLNDGVTGSIVKGGVKIGDITTEVDCTDGLKFSVTCRKA